MTNERGWLSDYADMLLERVCCTETSRADRRAAEQRVAEIKAYLAVPAKGSAQLIQRVNAARERKEMSDSLHADLVHALASGMGNEPTAHEPRGVTSVCTHPVLLDDPQQPRVDVYICAHCRTRISLLSYKAEPAVQQVAGGAR